MTSTATSCRPLFSSGRVTTATGTVDAGGVEYLATHVANLRAENKRTVLAGDMIGATPLLSALLHDEPSVEAFNRMKLDFNAVGNHEFDEGTQELLRMQQGDCHPVDGCLDGDGFTGARFRYRRPTSSTTNRQAAVPGLPNSHVCR